jgi:DNA-binding winged helix-turn-helix (wHTH) protein/tetratricopeptide (TPR) repeat protein
MPEVFLAIAASAAGSGKYQGMTVRFASFEFDRERAELRGPDGKAIKLRTKTLEMLALFATSAGRVLSKQELMEAVWPDVHVGEDNLFQCIRELRIALRDDRRQLIRLVSGRGYQFEAEVATVGPGQVRRVPATVTVMPVSVVSDDRAIVAMALGVTNQITDGLAGIDNIRVVAPPADPASPQAMSTRPARAHFVVSAELQKNEEAWTLHARMVETADQEVHPVASIIVGVGDSDFQLQQSRLAAGIGHALARRINTLTDAAGPAHSGNSAGSARVAIEQATASIKQMTRERFAAAQAMLEQALAADPDNVDVAVALAALQLRGIQLAWYNADQAVAAEARARAILEHALQAKPNSIPVLETWCRHLIATNHFVEALVACARTLNFDPWNGLILFHLGLAQLQLGRFEDALATFQRADRFDTPQVSRWTWLLGAGWTLALMGRDEEALPWLERSVAITPGSGRAQMLIAAIHHRLGRADEARAIMAKAIELWPGSTATNIAMPTKNASPDFSRGRAAGEAIGHWRRTAGGLICGSRAAKRRYLPLTPAMHCWQTAQTSAT